MRIPREMFSGACVCCRTTASRRFTSLYVEKAKRECRRVQIQGCAKCRRWNRFGGDGKPQNFGIGPRFFFAVKSLGVDSQRTIKSPVPPFSCAPGDRYSLYSHQSHSPRRKKSEIQYPATGFISGIKNEICIVQLLDAICTDAECLISQSFLVLDEIINMALQPGDST